MEVLASAAAGYLQFVAVVVAPVVAAAMIAPVTATAASGQHAEVPAPPLLQGPIWEVEPHD